MEQQTRAELDRLEAEADYYQSAADSQRRRLEAAAPDLLDACESALEIMNRVFPNGLPVQQGTFCEEVDWGRARFKCQDAIAKAKAK